MMNETNGDGVGRIVDASGVPSVVNNCFTMLRYIDRCVWLLVTSTVCLEKVER